MLGEDKIRLESKLNNSRKDKEHSLEELKRVLDEHVVASRCVLWCCYGYKIRGGCTVYPQNNIASPYYDAT